MRKWVTTASSDSTCRSPRSVAPGELEDQLSLQRALDVLMELAFGYLGDEGLDGVGPGHGGMFLSTQRDVDDRVRSFAARRSAGQAGLGTPPGSPPGSSGVASMGAGGRGSGASGSSSAGSSGTGSSGSISRPDPGSGSTMCRVNQRALPTAGPRGAAGRCTSCGRWTAGTTRPSRPSAVRVSVLRSVSEGRLDTYAHDSTAIAEEPIPSPPHGPSCRWTEYVLGAGLIHLSVASAPPPHSAGASTAFSWDSHGVTRISVLPRQSSRSVCTVFRVPAG